MPLNTLALVLASPPSLPPRHAHDCAACRYIGREDFAGEPERDVYVCFDSGERTELVIRRSSNPEDFTSFGVQTARAVAHRSPVWRGVVSLYDGWVEAGSPA